jgi:hypothetical protein
MRIVILLTAALFASVQQATCQTPAPAATQMMSWQGLGLVRLGMSIAEAERALGMREYVVRLRKQVPGGHVLLQGAELAPRADGKSAECWVTQRADGKDENVFYWVMNDKIVVIAAMPAAGKPRSANVTDMRGIGIGSSEVDIRRTYGDVKIVPAPGNSSGAEVKNAKERARPGIKLSEPVPSLEHWVQVESPNHQRAIVFDTRDDKIRWLKTGFLPAVMAEEGCS